MQYYYRLKNMTKTTSDIIKFLQEKTSFNLFRKALDTIYLSSEKDLSEIFCELHKFDKYIEYRELKTKPNPKKFWLGEWKEYKHLNNK